MSNLHVSITFFIIGMVISLLAFIEYFKFPRKNIFLIFFLIIVFSLFCYFGILDLKNKDSSDKNHESDTKEIKTHVIHVDSIANTLIASIPKRLLTITTSVL